MFLNAEEIGVLIRDAREGCGWSRPQLLRESRLSLSREHVRKIELGSTEAPAEKLDTLLRALGMRLVRQVVQRDNPRHRLWLRLWRFCNEADEAVLFQAVEPILSAWEEGR